MLSAADIAERMNVSVRTARRYLLEMDHVTVGRIKRVSEQAFDLWLRSHQQTGTCQRIAQMCNKNQISNLYRQLNNRQLNISKKLVKAGLLTPDGKIKRREV